MPIIDNLARARARIRVCVSYADNFLECCSFAQKRVLVTRYTMIACIDTIHAEKRFFLSDFSRIAFFRTETRQISILLQKMCCTSLYRVYARAHAHARR